MGASETAAVVRAVDRGGKGRQDQSKASGSTNEWALEFDPELADDAVPLGLLTTLRPRLAPDTVPDRRAANDHAKRTRSEPRA